MRSPSLPLFSLHLVPEQILGKCELRDVMHSLPLSLLRQSIGLKNGIFLIIDRRSAGDVVFL
jgi:hypothetical protein